MNVWLAAIEVVDWDSIIVSLRETIQSFGSRPKGKKRPSGPFVPAMTVWGTRSSGNDSKVDAVANKRPHSRVNSRKGKPSRRLPRHQRTAIRRAEHHKVMNAEGGHAIEREPQQQAAEGMPHQPNGPPAIRQRVKPPFESPENTR